MARTAPKKVMTTSELALVIENFPDRAMVSRRLYLADAGFRDLCEDFALAHATLQGFGRRADAASRPEIAEYREIIRDLANEIEVRLQRAERLAKGDAQT